MTAADTTQTQDVSVLMRNIGAAAKAAAATSSAAAAGGAATLKAPVPTTATAAGSRPNTPRLSMPLVAM